ncbi:MAG: aminotransferase class V-fold PLP-dependent enzyme, partial [Panacagrimonas sp.]
SALAGATVSSEVTHAAGTDSAARFADWAWIRAQFDLTPEYLHFSQFFIVSHPRPVREAVERHRRAIDANPFLAVEHGTFGDGEENLSLRSRRAVADYIDGHAEEIALVDCTTTGLALIYHGLALKPGDEVLTTTHDHYVHHESIRLATQKLGATWRRVPLYAQAGAVTVEEVTAKLRAAISPKTRVVGLTWVHSATGVKLPIRELAAVVAEANRRRDPGQHILLVVDGVHGFGNQDESPVDMGCDFFAAGTHKWIFAPRGTGIVWARAGNWARIRPTVPSFSSSESFGAWMDERDPGPTQASAVTPGGFKAYEHQWAMTEAFAFHQAMGRKRVADRIAALNTQCKEGLAAMSHVTLHTPRSAALSAGINCFEVAGMDPDTVVRKLLEKKVVASSSPYKVSYARLAPSLVNDEQQVERALEAVRGLV